jgi:tRNA1Val (adenine37-N6)-methyltransferase
MKAPTSDSFFNGQIRIRQDQCGYRFSIDAVILAYHVRPRPGDKVLDLGTGCGIIPLILAFRHPQIMVYGIEVQKELSALASFNVKDNHMEEHITILCEDMKLLKSEKISGLVDLVVCNPPYRRSNSGRINPDHQRAVARHEIKAALSDVIACAKRMLRTAGRFVTIYTAERTAELLAQMQSRRIEPKILRAIHSSRHSDAKMILVEGIRGGAPGMRIESPLILYDEEGNYTKEVKQMFAA